MSLKKLVWVFLIVLHGSASAFFPFTRHKTFTLMLDPAGDAQHTGRQVDDSFERGIALQCAEKLKALLEQQHSHIRVVLTRFPGETLQPLQNANFANKLDVDCYISIHFYHEQATRPHIYLYQFSYGDDFVSKAADLAFYPYDKAHIINMHTTKQWATTIATLLDQDLYKKQFDFKGSFRLPFKPLIGIKAPALAFEMGLKSKDDWGNYVAVMAESLRPIIGSV